MVRGSALVGEGASQVAAPASMPVSIVPVSVGAVGEVPSGVTSLRDSFVGQKLSPSDANGREAADSANEAAETGWKMAAATAPGQFRGPERAVLGR